MNRPSLTEELDRSIDVLLAASNQELPQLNHEVSDLLEVGRELTYLPRAEFKARLKADLQEQAFAIASASSARESNCETTILPTLFGRGYGNYPIQRRNLAASLVLHAAAAALVVSSGVWMAQHSQPVKEHVVALLTEPSPYALPAAPDTSGGGGGGGDADKVPATKGTPPRFARQQLAPPAVVIRTSDPKLVAEATVVGPPQLTFPQSGATGDPTSKFLFTASNGTGSSGGIGSGYGGGVGSGRGAGVGRGYGGGIGGGIFRVGGGVSAPHAIYDPDPEYSEEARQANYQGTVILWAVIGPDGRPRELRVARSLGMGLDEKAMEAVRNWRFEPAKKDGQPVAVQINIEVNFRLY